MNELNLKHVSTSAASGTFPLKRRRRHCPVEVDHCGVLKGPVLTHRPCEGLPLPPKPLFPKKIEVDLAKKSIALKH